MLFKNVRAFMCTCIWPSIGISISPYSM
jgi:hypothetical protein